MIWRLEYCNKDGVQARLDIIRGASTPVEVIEGTATPFILNYKLDKPDKSGFLMTSSADISIFETPTFNIDNLKTSSETEIKVEHYINGVLDWSGFVIPDFFSKTIGTPATVEMVVSDRLGTLKGVTLDDLNQYESMRSLAVKCLAKTGLSLPLYTMADFVNNGQTNAFFKSLGLSGRLSDTKGRNISCYDILKSILVASESKLVQQSGSWYIVNKFQHEQGSGNLFSSLTASTAYSEQTVSFSDVHVGARRSIVPVGATTGVFQEFGGGRSYPDNFDFRQFNLLPSFSFPDWTKVGTFNLSRGNKEIIGYNFDGQMQFGTETVDDYFFNSNTFNLSNYLQMDGIPIPYTSGQIEVVIDLNATAQTVSQFLSNVTAVKIAVGAVKSGSPTLWLNNNGVFSDASVVVHDLNFGRGSVLDAQTQAFNVKGVINNPDGYSIIMRIYGSRDEAETNRREVAVHFAKVSFKNTQESPKGNIFKRNQGTGFTKEHDIDTTIFGDYMRKGLDGYFYEYPLDDTSSLYSTAGTLTEPLWTAHGDTEQLPLLRHVTRQKSRMFSVAHNMISARINVATFKPLNIFVDCNSVNPRHVVVSASYDFLRSEVEVELEQIAYATLDVREFIYSYFGDGESGISSVGGISGGGTGTGGGGMTAEQIELLNTVAGYWSLDEDGNLKTTYNAYSEKEMSAYGFGGSGGGGGGLIENVYGYSNLGGTFSNADLNNTFNAYTINQLHLRIETLESGGGSGSVTSVGLSAPTGFTVSGSPVTSSGTLNLAFASGYSLPTTAKQTAWDNHLSATNNPHGVTASQVGALALTGGTMANTNLVTNLNADLLDGKQGTRYRGEVNLGHIADFEQVVIGLVNLDNSSIERESWSSGQLYANRPNGSGWGALVVNYSLQKRYNTSNMWAYLNTTTSGIDLCTFTYNGIKYGGIRFFPSATQVYGGLRLYGRWSDTAPFVVKYRNNSGVLNSEVDSSIVINGSDVLEQRLRTGSNIYAFTSDNVASATKLQTPRTIWGQSFDGTGNVSGALTGVTNITASGQITVPKVIFSAAGWSMVQVGTELQMQYNGVAKMRFLNGGSIVAVQEITAYS